MTTDIFYLPPAGVYPFNNYNYDLGEGLKGVFAIESSYSMDAQHLLPPKDIYNYNNLSMPPFCGSGYAKDPSPLHPNL